MSQALKQASEIRAQEMAAFVRRCDAEMKAAYKQMANDLARFHWGTDPGPTPAPLTRTERFGYWFGAWWYFARMGMVRGFARILCVSLPRDDD